MRPKSLQSRYKSEAAALVNAIHRCHNEQHRAYYNYGARGIQVCEEWRNLKENGFKAFLDHIGPKPFPNLTLDRIDNDGHYEPNNVRWATRSEQSLNRRSKYQCRRITLNGKTQSINQWAREYGLNSGTVWARIRRNWPDEILLRPADYNFRLRNYLDGR